jgi:hypothetical protein
MAGGDVLFYDYDQTLQTGAVRRMDGQNLASNLPLFTDFCTDYSGQIFGLNAEGALVSVKNGIATQHGGRYDGIALSGIAADNLCGFGDLLLLDSITHSLKKISASAAGVADMAAGFSPPDIGSETTAHARVDLGFVASVRFDTPLFRRATEAEEVTKLTAGSDIFIRHDVPSPDDMYFAVAEDHDGQKLIYGYVYRPALNTPDAYSPPQKNTGRVIIATSEYKYVYKYPSLYAAKVSEVAKSDMIKLLPFVAGYKDTNGHEWVRVDLGVGEGYMRADGLSWSLFSGDRAAPNTNAAIKDNAFLYIYNPNTKDYELWDGVQHLAKNKRVEVQTPFDSSSKYTKVIFSITNDDGIVEVIDIDCYVETKYIDFDGADVLQIAAIIAAVIASILLIVLIVWFFRKRKKRTSLVV